MSTLDLFLALSKIDLDQRLIQGVATAEAPDRVGEICDYASTKPYFEAWSAEALKASGGKSLGAVRAMHGRVAAGKLTDIAFDDDDKRILISARIVDDDEWRKVQEGVYTSLARQRLDLEQTRQATEVAVGRLGERFAQMQEEHYRLRESIGALPTRVDMRSLEEHIGERLDALATRLDRMIDA